MYQIPAKLRLGVSGMTWPMRAFRNQNLIGTNTMKYAKNPEVGKSLCGAAGFSRGGGWTHRGMGSVRMLLCPWAIHMWALSGICSDHFKDL